MPNSVRYAHSHCDETREITHWFISDEMEATLRFEYGSHVDNPGFQAV